jgi:hypothetical protein
MIYYITLPFHIANIPFSSDSTAVSYAGTMQT